MTQNRRSKRLIRSRMAQTGEKYTEARRAHLASGGHSGDASAGEYPGDTITWPEDSLGWFTDQAYNAILLAADEARMLSHPRVDPEHLLLAAARYLRAPLQLSLVAPGVPWPVSEAGSRPSGRSRHVGCRCR